MLVNHGMISLLYKEYCMDKYSLYTEYHGQPYVQKHDSVKHLQRKVSRANCR